MSMYYAPDFKITVNGQDLQAISGNILQIVVTKGVDSVADTCVLTIANAAPAMRWTHSPDARLFWIGGEVQVDMGYADEMHSAMMQGTITGVSASFPSSGVSTVTVTCTGYGQKLIQSQKTTIHKGKSDKQIAQQIAQDADLQVEAEETDLVHDYIIQPNQTDYQFLRARANLLHYELFVEGKTLHFRKPKENDEPSWTFVWSPAKSYSTSGNRTLPLKSFTPNANALNQQYTETQVRAHDAKTKQTIVGTASSQEENLMHGTEPGSSSRQKAVGSCQKTHATQPAASQAEVDQLAKASQNKSAQNYVGGKGQTIGVPDLQPGIVVYLDGLGLFTGNYYVISAVHTIGSGGYTTDFTARRNSTNAS